MIQLDRLQNIKIIGGSRHLSIDPEKPFSDISLNFLDELSINLKNYELVKKFPDLMTFSFWCRKRHLEQLKKKQTNIHKRIGRGLVFHVAPSNVPLNFGYSYIFGLLSGNTNIVKISSKGFPQAEILCQMLDSLLKKEKYQSLYKKSAFVKYDNETDLTKYFSSICDSRIVWGGDSTIKSIRSFETPVRSTDIAFADRYSICVINTKELTKLPKKDFYKVTKNFFNDTFVMDQNACSSPHIVLWFGVNKKKIINEFWEALGNYAKKNYEIDNISALEKYKKLCQISIGVGNQFKLNKFENLIYRLSLKKIPKNIHELRGNCGFFFEYEASCIDEISFMINNKYQTLTYFGFEKEFLADFVFKNNLRGIDRIVPIGNALDIGLDWDGFEMVSSLSRIISFS